MRKIKKYEKFLILEKFDDNILAELKRLGIKDKSTLNFYLYHAHRGNLGNYVNSKGESFTFGLLNAIFKDAIEAKRKTEIKKSIFNILPSAIPLALAPFFPILAVIGIVFGTSKMFHRVFDPIFSYLNPQSKYSEFLKKVIDGYMKIPTGDVPVKDRFTRAFVVEDRIIEAIKPEVLEEFSEFLSEKMENENPDEEVPGHYVENELKKYLNETFDINPEIPLKEGFTYKDLEINIKDILRDISDDDISLEVSAQENGDIVIDINRILPKEYTISKYKYDIEHLNSFMEENGYTYTAHRFYNGGTPEISIMHPVKSKYDFSGNHIFSDEIRRLDFYDDFSNVLNGSIRVGNLKIRILFELNENINISDKNFAFNQAVNGINKLNKIQY